MFLVILRKWDFILRVDHAILHCLLFLVVLANRRIYKLLPYFSYFFKEFFIWRVFGLADVFVLNLQCYLTRISPTKVLWPHSSQIAHINNLGLRLPALNLADLAPTQILLYHKVNFPFVVVSWIPQSIGLVLDIHCLRCACKLQYMAVFTPVVWARQRLFFGAKARSFPLRGVTQRLCAV